MKKLIKSKLVNIAKKFPAINPNIITISALLFSIIGFILILYNNIYSIAIFILAFVADALDGAIARAHDLVSNKGAFIDGTIDRIVEFFFLLGIAMKGYWLSSFIILFFSSCMHSFIKAYAFYRAKKEVKPSFFGRETRVFVFIILLFIYFYYNNLFYYSMVLTALFSLISFLQVYWNSLSIIKN